MVPTLMNCVSRFVSGCLKVVDSRCSAIVKSSSKAGVIGGATGPTRRRILAMHHASVSPSTILSLAPKMLGGWSQWASFSAISGGRREWGAGSGSGAGAEREHLANRDA